MALAAHPGEPMSREALGAYSQFTGNERTVDVQITRLRKKIERDPKFPALSPDDARYRLCPSNPTDAIPARPPPGLQLRTAGGGLLKRMLPRTLFGRSILILVTPLILVQAVAAWVFYDRLWDTVMHRLSAGVVGEIALVLETRHLVPRGTEREIFFDTASSTTELEFKLAPEGLLKQPAPPATGSQIERQLTAALNERLRLPYQIDEESDPHNVMVELQLHDALLTVTVPRSRLYTSNSYIVLMWMVGTALVTFAVAAQFLRNQVRSLRRLAIAAEAFGKGRDMPNFKPEGASEVRQAAAAFLVMRERIQRQITQRTEMLAG